MTKNTFASLRYLHCNKYRIYSHPLRSQVGKRGIRELKKATFLSHARQPELSCFFYLRCFHTTIFILFSIFSQVETISLKIWERPIPGMRNLHFRFPSVTQKRRFLKLSIELFQRERLSLYPALTSWKTLHRSPCLCLFKGMECRVMIGSATTKCRNWLGRHFAIFLRGRIGGFVGEGGSDVKKRFITSIISGVGLENVCFQICFFIINLSLLVNLPGKQHWFSQRYRDSYGGCFPGCE